MKITKQQLRKIISETINTTAGESLGNYVTTEDVIPVIDDDKLSDLIYDVCDRWLADYDVTDPSMKYVGEAGWIDQVNEARNEAYENVAMAVRRAVISAMNAEFASLTKRLHKGDFGPAINYTEKDFY